MMGGDSMVFHKENGKIMSGGMTVSSILMLSGNPISYSSKEETMDPLRDVLGRGVVPAGLVVLQDHFNSKIQKPTGIKLCSEPVSESMFDQLNGLKDTKSKAKKTRVRRDSGKKKTRKQK